MRLGQGDEIKKFNCLYREIDSMYHEIALGSGLSDSAFLILYTLAELGDGCLQAEIAAANSISKQTIHTSAKKLEKEGLLSFRPGKGRDMHLCLTEAGRRVMEEKILPVFEAENRAFLEMGKEDCAMFLRLAERYAGMLRVQLSKIL